MLALKVAEGFGAEGPENSRPLRRFRKVGTCRNAPSNAPGLGRGLTSVQGAVESEETGGPCRPQSPGPRPLVGHPSHGALTDGGGLLLPIFQKKFDRLPGYGGFNLCAHSANATERWAQQTVETLHPSGLRLVAQDLKLSLIDFPRRYGE